MSNLSNEEKEELKKELSKLKSQKVVSVNDKLRIQKLQQLLFNE
jgi:hypothetical protein